MTARVSDYQSLPNEVDPSAAMLRILWAGWLSMAGCVVAKLGIADELVNGPKTADELAAVVNAHGPSLYRLLRALATADVFIEDDQHRFANTPISETLKSGDQSLRAYAILNGERPITSAWAELMSAARTGGSAFEKAHGATLFEYIECDEALARIFGGAMTSRSAMELRAVTEGFDFSSANTLVDVGGGRGFLLGSILARNPSQRGVLYDLPIVVAEAKPVLEHLGVADRCDIAGGNFFDAVPAGADGYLLKHVLHNWEDDRCVKLLRNIHAAAKPGARLFILESVVPSGNTPHMSKHLDLMMLVMTHGGRERTQAEWEAILTAGEFVSLRFMGLAGPLSVIEARRA
jgi:O-methyltransferase domain